jgi:superfamily I DNA/RNA helicase
MEKSPTSVRLLTVHRAKGLEFPFVIIPEVQRPLASDDLAPWLYVVPDCEREGTLITEYAVRVRKQVSSGGRPRQLTPPGTIRIDSARQLADSA